MMGCKRLRGLDFTPRDAADIDAATLAALDATYVASASLIYINPVGAALDSGAKIAWDTPEAVAASPRSGPGGT